MNGILIVEDDANIRDTLLSMMEAWMESNQQKQNIYEVCNGAEALLWIEQNGEPDMLLLDVRMPLMNGSQFLYQLSKQGLDLRHKTLLLTGYADDLEEHMGKDALLMLHLRKPFMVAELFTALDTLSHQSIHEH